MKFKGSKRKVIISKKAEVMIKKTEKHSTKAVKSKADHLEIIKLSKF